MHTEEGTGAIQFEECLVHSYIYTYINTYIHTYIHTDEGMGAIEFEECLVRLCALLSKQWSIEHPDELGNTR